MRLVFFAILVPAIGAAQFFSLTAPFVAPKHRIHDLRVAK